MSVIPLLIALMLRTQYPALLKIDGVYDVAVCHPSLQEWHQFLIELCTIGPQLQKGQLFHWPIDATKSRIALPEVLGTIEHAIQRVFYASYLCAQQGIFTLM